MKLVANYIMIFTLLLSCSPSDATPTDTVGDTTSIPDNTDNGTSTDTNVNGNPETATINILFVGNSLTYYNDLPTLVYEFAKAKNERVSTKMVAKPNYAIIDHLDNGDEVESEIKSKAYDYVVVQQGPSSQSEGRRLLFEGGRRLTALCNENNAKLTFFMVWPSRAYYHTFDGVIQNHTEVASEYNALLCPVGKEWKAYFDSTDDFSYYGPDQFHPSLKGSRVAAEIILNTLLADN